MNCIFCGQPDGELHVCASGTYATIKVSRALYDIFKLRMEQVGLACGEMDIGEEPTKAKYVRWFEMSLCLLDVSASQLRHWMVSGERRVTGTGTDKTR